ncbi:hypothetical protein AGOR_G00165100 [Albula goreensis]|uniref:Myosin tail domain-containing protein n=1 Tax=Albula goreensis TaxID=1534307 RepID=A0A8T3D1U9_9TELE|nr:hypothetical protein AGOR_G00165100 [Albula goreensis]
MESSRVGGLPNGVLQQGYANRTARSQDNGLYGLTIRVKGIDGHPYVVMNNQYRDENSGVNPQSNGTTDKDCDCEKDLKEVIESRPKSPFVEDRSQKQTSHNGMKGFRESQKKPSSVSMNQMEPELVNPYAAENFSLSLDRYRSRPSSGTSSVETPAKHQYSLPRASSAPVKSRSPSLNRHLSPEPPQDKKEAQPKTEPQTQPLAKSRVQPPAQSQTQPQPTVKTQPQVPAKSKTPAVAHAPIHSTKFPSRSPSTVSSPTSPDESGRKPDLLLLKRHDSCGPELSLSRSRHSSTSSSSGRTFPEDQQEALYADTINRHENRRYIPFLPGTGRDIDTAHIPGVDELIEKFSGTGTNTQHRRGRAGRRNRINPEDRKRSRSVDSALPFGLRGDPDYLDKFSKNQGRSTEHVLRPSQLGLQKSTYHHDEKDQDSSTPESPQGAVFNGTSSIPGYKRVLMRSSTLQLKSKASEEDKPSRSVKVLTNTTPGALTKTKNTDKQTNTARDAQVTPDLLKGQQDLSQQTNEETARQILFNYLRDGSADNDDSTKKKVNLVFEKIQTLRSRAVGNVQGDKPPDAARERRTMQELKAQLESRVVDLTEQLKEEVKKQRSLSEACERAGADARDLREKLKSSQDECKRLKEQLCKTEAELHSTVEELFQVKMEREQCQSEVRDLQDQLSEMHDELDCAKRPGPDEEEKQVIMQAMMHLKMDLEDVLLAKEEKEEVLRKRERELTALKGALKEEVASHDQEVDKMKEQYEQELQKLRLSMEEAKQASNVACQEKGDLEAAKSSVEGRAARLSQEVERLHRRAQELENEVAKLNRIIDEAKLQESRLDDRVARLEKERKQLELSLEEARQEEEETSLANRTLATRLDDSQRSLARLTQDHKDLNERLKEENNQKELLKKTKSQVEEERRLLDRAVEKLQKEMSEIVEASQASTQELQVQINEYKDKNRRELAELQRQLRDKGLEQDKARLAMKTLQEEMSHLEADLRECKRERDEAVLRGQDLERKVYDLEVDLETRSHKDDKSRQMKLMEDRISQLEQDLEEERSSGDDLMDRVTRGREQVEQMRNELLQERAARQDLECDKTALERRNKDLKSRLAHLEGSQKSSKEGLVSQLEGRIQELEERLEGEERERANLLQVNRKLERKVKDMTMQLDDERHSMQDQKDQLNLKLKALKRQMDEAEEEIERLEHGRKKLQRDLDEQVETNDQLQGQLNSLRNEMRRKSAPVPHLNDLDDDEYDDDDDISTDGEFFYNATSAYK